MAVPGRATPVTRKMPTPVGPLGVERRKGMHEPICDHGGERPRILLAGRCHWDSVVESGRRKRNRGTMSRVKEVGGDSGTAQRGFALISGADMTDGAAAIPYAIADIPTRPQPYFVLAFLDDDESASPIYPTPGSGDLVGYVSNPLPGPPSVDLSVEGEHVLNIILTVAMP